ncbi:MAG: YgeY family selenium metabolism-linked hydrolase, partial [Aminobacteriaceae bacterium]
MIPFEKVLSKAEEYRPKMSRFLRDMIALPSESCGEKDVISRIRAEMEACGYDRVEIDPMGNVLGFIGTGRHLIALDAHIDTVGIGDRSLWHYDPYEGYEDDEIIVG